MEEKIGLGDMAENAIVIENGHKSYSSGRKTTSILQNLDIQVQRGRIYGLLGPSGCGKTTLLKCIVGKLRLDSGKVTVFGQVPGSRLSGVPGARVGYMPQELALFMEFSIEETLRYFSRIFGMSEKIFEERLEFLMNFLDLPSKTRQLEKMSGGQQRRASLAVALLHQPDLLILDEPTVGVDPLLRQSIWDHLVQLSDEKGQATTIVITTHYTEEAMQAHRVGMMRNGRLLAEDTPASLLAKYNMLTLEQVFLHLCVSDTGTDEVGDVLDSISVEKQKKEQSEDTVDGEGKLLSLESSGIHHRPEETKEKSDKSDKSDKASHNFFTPTQFNPRIVSACMLKTFNRMSKRWGFLIYQFLLPALQVSLFCLAIGQDPQDLPISFISEELEPGYQCSGEHLECPLDINIFTGSVQPNEFLGNVSCRYLQFLNGSTILPVWESSQQSALESVERGDTWGSVYMDANFSSALFSRIFHTMGGSLLPPSQETVKSGSIRIKMDVTNQQIAFTLQLKMVQAFQQFLAQIVESCHLPSDLVSVPLEFEEPVYGSDTLTFTDFMAPGIILTIVHSMALGYSAMIIIIERNEGLLDRTWVAGVSAAEFSLAHFLCAISINTVQVVLTLAFMIGVFKVPVEGSLFLIFLLTLLQGMCGITIGLIISSVCKTQQDATQIALGIFYPNMLLSGILWPLEAMPVALRYIAYTLPQTCACEAMRAILLRGWDLHHPVVSRGFLVTLAWTLVTYLIFKVKVSRSN